MNQSRVLAPLLAMAIVVASQGAATATGELVGRLKETKENLAEAETEKRKVLGALYAINQRMKKIASRKGQLTDELVGAQESVKNVAMTINTLEVQIKRQRSILKRRLRAMYKISGEGFLGAVFSKKDAYELDSTMRALRIVSDFDYQMIKTYRENIRSLAQKRQALRSQVSRLLVVEKRIRVQEELLAKEHRAKSDLALQVEAQAKSRRNEMKRLRSRAVNEPMDGDLALLLKPSLYERKGKLALPLQAGILVRGFGVHIDPRYRFRVSHKGWRLRPNAEPESAPVFAVDEGEIVFKGPMDGYGDVLILDHRDHYYTVYAGQVNSALHLGDRVDREQVIGRVRGELYFEIRHFSEPEDPTTWIKVAPRVLTFNQSADDNRMKQQVVMEN